MKYWSLSILFSCMFLLGACLAGVTSAPTPPLQAPVLVPAAQPAANVTAPPQRILLIGSLFSKDIDIFLKGLVQAANPTAQLEVASIILPAT